MVEEELDDEDLRGGLAAHCDEVRRWPQTAPHLESVEVDYPTLVRDPAAMLPRLVGSLDTSDCHMPRGWPLPVEPALYRRQAGP